MRRPRAPTRATGHEAGWFSRRRAQAPEPSTNNVESATPLPSAAHGGESSRDTTGPVGSGRSGGRGAKTVEGDRSAQAGVTATTELSPGARSAAWTWPMSSRCSGLVGFRADDAARYASS